MIVHTNQHVVRRNNKTASPDRSHTAHAEIFTHASHFLQGAGSKPMC